MGALAQQLALAGLSNSVAAIIESAIGQTGNISVSQLTQALTQAGLDNEAAEVLSARILAVPAGSTRVVGMTDAQAAAAAAAGIVGTPAAVMSEAEVAGVKSVVAIDSVDARKFFSGTQEALWRTAPPSPYAASQWSGMTEWARAGIEAEGKKTAWESMTLTQRQAITHPSLVFINSGLSGYKYWMAYTPYSGMDDSFENPCIAASLDGVSWVTPAGVLNPLVQPPAGSEFLSDTHLYFDSTTNSLVLLYRSRSASQNKLWIITSKDGVSWSAPTLIWTGLLSAAEDMASPSIWRDVNNGQWVIIAHAISTNGTWPIVKMTSPELLSGWPGHASAVAVNMPPPDGRRWWHSHFQQLKTGEIIGVVQDNSGVQGGSGFVFLARSFDGANFSTSRISWTEGGLYRPTLAVLPGGAVALVYSSLLGVDFAFRRYKVGELIGGREGDAYRSISALQAGAMRFGGVLLADSFDRADASAGVNPIGTSSGGQLWANVSSTDTIGIIGNSATNTTLGNCRAIFNVGVNEYSLLAQIGDQARYNADNIIIRWVDENNFLRITLISTPPRLESVISGVLKTEASITGADPAANGLVRVDVFRDRVRYFLNGVIFLDFQTSQFSGATFVGIQSSGVVGERRWSSIAVLT